jgi:outer membrane cobalamin receptor
MRLNSLPVFLLLVSASLLCTVFAFSTVAQPPQTDTATIAGTVSDPSGAPVSEARIAATPLGAPSAARNETTSDHEGKFSLSLPPGKYRVSVTLTAFQIETEEFTLVAGAVRTWDVHLALAPLSSDVIVTSQAEPEQAANVVAPVDVLTREQIDEREVVWLTPVLASVPGMSFSQLGPMGGVTSFFLDGGDSNYTKVLVDGTPVNQPGGAIDLSNYSADDVDKIEIVHGASSALYGSDAMDGVIQIFTRRGSTPSPQLILEGDGGTFGTGHGSGQLSGLAGAFDYSLGAGYFDSDGQGADNYYRDTTLSGNFGYKFSDADTLRLTVRNSASDGGQPGQTLLAAESPFAVDPGQHNVLHDFSSNLVWNFATGEHWQNQISGYESRFYDAETSPPFGTFISDFNRTGLNAQSTYSFANGGLTTGYMFEVENGGVSARHNQAGYTEVRYNVRPRLSVVVGGRVEANGFFGTRAVPRVGASYALRYGSGFWGATRVRASYGEGIKEPTLFPPDCTPVLKPEQSTTVDAGLDQYVDSERVHFSLTFFHNDFRDIVSFASMSDPTLENCPAFGGSYFNTDKARAYGANSSIEWKPASWLNFLASYSYDDTLVLSSPNATDPALMPGNRLLKRPLNSADLVLNAHWHGVNWNFSGYYVGTRTDSDFLGLAITRDPGYIRWDMAASAPIYRTLSATAQFANLFDRHYQDAVGYPALGYNYRVGIRYVWGGESGSK